MTKLSLTDWVVLALIDEEPRHGFSAARELREGGQIGQVWTVPGPLVYRAIDHLSSSGLIEQRGVEPGAQGPVRTIYAVTDLGAQRIRDWIEQPVDHPRDVRSELVLKLVLMERHGWPTAQLVTRQLDRFRPVEAGLEDKSSRAEGPDRVVARWRLASLKAIIHLLEEMADDAEGNCSH